MLYCPNCGKEVSIEMNVCPHCGGVLTNPNLSTQADIRIKPTTQKTVPKDTDFLSIISLGVVIMLIGFTYYRYTIDLSLIRTYIEYMITHNVFIKPPLALINPMVFLFNAAGFWGIVLSGLRLLFEKNVRKAFSDLFGAFFAFLSAYLLTNYASNVFTERMLGAYFAIAIGLLIVGNSVITLSFLAKK